MLTISNSPAPALPRREEVVQSAVSPSLSLRVRAGVGLFLVLLSLLGCITEYEATGIEEVAGILVVDGIITDDESVIVLSRSAGLNHDDSKDMSAYSVPDAKVYIECDDGTQWEAVFHPDWDWGFGRGNGSRYSIENGKLKPERQYRLKIVVETGHAPSFPQTGHAPSLQGEYQSEFAYPMISPEIDSVFWMKRGKGQPVNIHVATHAPDDEARYYRWSYREDWEIRAKVPMRDSTYAFVCSKKNINREILLGTTEKTDLGRVTEILAKISPSDDRLEHLYRMDVTQFAISKRAFDYQKNIKKNAQQTGGIMAHVPAELNGNITCISDPGRKVIGYVDVSSTTRGRLYIHRTEGLFEISLVDDCKTLFSMDLYRGLPPPVGYVVYDGFTIIERRCVDCIVAGGRPWYELPKDWPTRVSK